MVWTEAPLCAAERVMIRVPEGEEARNSVNVARRQSENGVAVALAQEASCSQSAAEALYRPTPSWMDETSRRGTKQRSRGGHAIKGPAAKGVAHSTGLTMTKRGGPLLSGRCDRRRFDQWFPLRGSLPVPSGGVYIVLGRGGGG